MEISVMVGWLIAGVVFLAAEAMGITGIGLLFAGIGALTVGTMLNMGMISPDATLLQAVIFLISSAIWAAILWKPMKKFRLNKNSPGFSNMVGETAYVGSAGISKLHGGEVTWSGTIMKAQMDAHVTADKLEAGSQVTITDVKGATLIVKPKH